MFTKVLVANRGAIACRILRTLRRMGLRSVAVYSEADRHARHVAEADESVAIGPAPASESYLNQAAILEAARRTGAQAVHPGYGFLSENAAFAEACGQAGLRFMGPTPDQMRLLGPKHSARALARSIGIPMLPGTGLLESAEQALAEAKRIGFPVMLKSTGGGGGIGMSLVRRAKDLPAAFESVTRLARNNFKDAGVFLERFVEQARHLEVQIFGDGRGNIVALGERECSVQRRNQKVIEETPAPGLRPGVREALLDCAVKLGKAAGYTSAGTVEFVYDNQTGEFHFLEVNTRLQVEHGVTEEVTGVDLVEWMVRAADGSLDLSNWSAEPRGASLQARIYAEDPGKEFQPSAGLLSSVHFPGFTRIETWVETGTEVSPFYDPMLAKVIARGDTREEAIDRLSAALQATRLHGIVTNQAYLQQILATEDFRAGGVTTRWLAGLQHRPATIDVLDGGTQTTVQDYPGRVGYWEVGVPPSGPMDSYSFRLANRILGNESHAAGLELTVTGPTLRFNRDTHIALTGATMQASLDGKPVAYNRPVRIKAGQVLRLGSIQGPGLRSYLAVEGGLDTPLYLGSRATFTLGCFGGHAGRALRPGDVLRLFGTGASSGAVRRPPAAILPALTQEWELGVLHGPHAAPEFFTEEDIQVLLSTPYEVHYNSARTGVRLIGPKPKWSRRDGGEAGLHPSNIHDNAYPVGAVDFTGDMPILLGPDGPSCGGFVCPFTVVTAELWKLGQLKPGDKVRFRVLTQAEARSLALTQDLTLETLQAPARAPALPMRTSPPEPAILARLPARPGRPSVVHRAAGDAYLLVEYGDPVLDIALRLRAHALQSWVLDRRIPGIIDLTPGIRSLQIHHDPRMLPQSRLVHLLLEAEEELPDVAGLEVPSRIVHLPLSWEDESTLLAIRKYQQIVRKDAPWCPSNLEFIRRINGLDTIEEVRRICFDASWLVLALGDVYLGAPVATPLDPRHRLVTTKYNPARTWTPENAVGIGGAYLCVYGMEGPGGYQFIGRTCQMWNRHRTTREFEPGHPWLLRCFDQIRFHPVSNQELLEFREAFPQGKASLRIEHTTFKLSDYQAFLAENAPSIESFVQRRTAAFQAELKRWEESGQLNFSAQDEAALGQSEETLPPGCSAQAAHIPGNVWKILVQPGDSVAEGAPLVILESMKMEVTATASRAGRVREVRCSEGRPVGAGETLIVLEDQPA